MSALADRTESGDAMELRRVRAVVLWSVVVSVLVVVPATLLAALRAFAVWAPHTVAMLPWPWIATFAAAGALAGARWGWRALGDLRMGVAEAGR